MKKCRYSRGFTLLEILLVMVLLSLTAVVVVPTFPSGNTDDAKKEAERFYQLIQLWNEQSLQTSQVMGVRFESDNYSLVKLDENDWIPVARKNRVVTSVDMPEAVELDIEIAGTVNTQDQLFSRDSLFEDLDFNENDEEKEQDPPQLVMMGNGEIFSFTLIFSVDNENLWRVEGTDVGRFKLISFNEDEE